jgi:ATP-dependent Clp protease ATP-binding subunit ClpB
MTSNLGAEIIVGDHDLASVGKDTSEISPEVRNAVMDVVSATYPPEFLNRLDEFIIFRRLSREALRDIVDIRLKELQQRLDDRRIVLDCSSEAKQWLCDRGYDPKFGARPLNRLIAREIGNGLADKLIRGEIRSGNVAKVTIRDDGDGLSVAGA